MLLSALIEPLVLFEKQRHAPTYFLPWAAVTSLTVALTLAYFLRVDPNWYALQQLSDVNHSPESASVSTEVVAWVGSAVAVFASIAGLVLTAGYLWLAARLRDSPLSYRQGLSLAAWAAVPSMLGSLVSLLAVFTMRPETPFEAVSLTSLDPLVVQLPDGHSWKPLAQSVSLLSIWTMYLMALGFRLWTNAGRLQSFLVALLPQMIVHGVVAAWA